MHPIEEERWNKVYEKIINLENGLTQLSQQVENFKKFRQDRNISVRCYRGDCQNCKGRNCRHQCHHDATVN